MAHYPDLANECQVAHGPHVRAVGWLSAEHEFPTSDEAPLALVERLAAFRDRWGHCVSALSWFVAGGSHRCELCGDAADSANIGIPDGELLWVCPGMTAHYVEAHRYAPPTEFVRALDRCALPGTFEYARAAVRFHPILREKDDDMRHIYAVLLSSHELPSFFALPEQTTVRNAIMIGEGYKPADHHRRLLLISNGGFFNATFGYGQFHEWSEFEVDEELAGLTRDEIVGLVRHRFRQRPPRRAR